MATVGIYQIRNCITGTIYIGSSVDIDNRLAQHRFQLTQERHGNKLLQRAWIQWGYEVFAFEVVELVPQTEQMTRAELTHCLRTREQYHLDRLQAYDNRFGYNIARKANDRPSPEEAHERFHAAMREVAKRPSHHMPKTRLKEPEIAAKVVATRRARNNYGFNNPEHRAAFDRTGKLASAETRQKKSESMLKLRAICPITEEHRTALIEGGKKTRIQGGIPTNPQQRAKWLASCTKPISTEELIAFFWDRKLTLAEIAQRTNMTRGGIRQRLKKAGHYEYRDGKGSEWRAKVSATWWKQKTS